MSEWQDISTAPKSKSILLRISQGTKSDRTLRKPGLVYVTEGYFTTNSEYSPSHGWYDYNHRMLCGLHTKKPKNIVTHWMPLPEPPQ